MHDGTCYVNTTVLFLITNRSPTKARQTKAQQEEGVA